MKLETLLKELRKSEKLSAKADVYVTQKGGPSLNISKIRTKGDLVIIYTESDDET